MDYYVKEYTVHFYEVDTKGFLSAPFLCRYMQESAWRHFEELGLGYSAMLEKGLLWQIVRQWIQIYRLPRWGDSIWLYTWPTIYDHSFCYRDFRIIDKDENLLVISTSSWQAMDLRKKIPVPTKRYYSISSPEGLDHIPINKLEKIGILHSRQHDLRIMVGYKDLDLYGKTNNVNYLQWVLETYDRSFHEQFMLKEILVNFLTDTDYNEQLLVYTQKISKTSFYHNLIKYGSNKEIYRCRLDWTKIR